MRLGLYSREEVMALARRMHIGFRAPDPRVIVEPPSPTRVPTSTPLQGGGRDPGERTIGTRSPGD